MSIIDQKGMIGFGKFRINIIDFLVLLFLLSLTPCLYFGWKIHTKAQVAPPPLMTEQSKYDELKDKCNKDLIEAHTLREKELQEKIRLQQKISDFLKEHKRARKYFE